MSARPEVRLPEAALTAAIFAGDASGDFQSAHLIRELRRRVRTLRVWGIGGCQMREAGADLVFDTSRLSSIGVVQALRLIPPLLAAKARLLQRLRSDRPDFVLAVDFGAFNLRVTPEALRMGLPVAYWFPPGSWRKTIPSSRIVQSADFFISPYPWYAESLREAGASAQFLGHPLLDQVKPVVSREVLLSRLDLPEDSEIIGLLPGSRGHEVENILPTLIEAASLLQDRLAGRARPLAFVVGLADHFPADQAAGLTERTLRRLKAAGRTAPRLALARNATRDTICYARAAAVCSGSVTLEALVAGTPMVVVYRGSRMMQFEYKVRRMNIKYIAMPNILADAPVVPELRQDEATPEAIAEHLAGVVADGPARNAQTEALGRLRAMLEPAGAMPRTAEALLAWAREEHGLGGTA